MTQPLNTGIGGRNGGRSSTNSARQCWICFATDEDDAEASELPQWVQPCKCKGTTKWAHQKCLLLWVDMKLKAVKDTKEVRCPQCKTLYKIFYPPANLIANILGKIDSVIYRSSPFVVGAFTISLIYWTTFTIGTVVLIQVVSLDNALLMMDELHPSVLFIGLPSIPICLLIFNMTTWEDKLLRLLRKIGKTSSFLGCILPETVENSEVRERSLGVNDGMTCTRVCAGAFLLPTISVFCGSFLKDKIESPVLRTLLGGLIFVGVTGVLSMYHKQQAYRRVGKMRILDYIPSPIDASGNTL